MGPGRGVGGWAQVGVQAGEWGGGSRWGSRQGRWGQVSRGKRRWAWPYQCSQACSAQSGLRSHAPFSGCTALLSQHRRCLSRGPVCHRVLPGRADPLGSLRNQAAGPLAVLHHGGCVLISSNKEGQRVASHTLKCDHCPLSFLDIY